MSTSAAYQSSTPGVDLHAREAIVARGVAHRPSLAAARPGHNPPAQDAASNGAPGAERRTSDRRTPAELGHQLRLSIAGAADATAINVSETGVLAETTDRLCPGRTTDLFVRLNGVRVVIRARVVRCFVYALAPRAIFRAALHFDEPLSLPDENR